MYRACLSILPCVPLVPGESVSISKIKLYYLNILIIKLAKSALANNSNININE